MGLPEARLQHALLCMAAAEGGMSMVLTVSLQRVSYVYKVRSLRSDLASRVKDIK